MQNIIIEKDEKMPLILTEEYIRFENLKDELEILNERIRGKIDSDNLDHEELDLLKNLRKTFLIQYNQVKKGYLTFLKENYLEDYTEYLSLNLKKQEEKVRKEKEAWERYENDAPLILQSLEPLINSAPLTQLDCSHPVFNFQNLASVYDVMEG